MPDGFRVLTVAVLTYLALDLLNPYVPGIFSFETDDYFLEGVIREGSTQKHSAAATNSYRAGAVEPVPFLVVKRAEDYPPPRPIHTHRALRKQADFSHSQRVVVTDDTPA